MLTTQHRRATLHLSRASNGRRPLGRWLTRWMLLALVPLAGCGSDAAPENPSSGESAPAKAPAKTPAKASGIAPADDGVTLAGDSARGHFQIRIRPEGGTIPLNESFAVLVDLIDPATGERMTDYSAVTLDARMPAHGHGMLRDVELEPMEDGSLRAEGLLFHMIGNWEFHVDMTRGPRVERAQASYDLTL